MNTQSNKKPSISLKITREIKDSGFLAVHQPEDLQTLIALFCFADRNGQCLVSGRELARTLNISIKQALGRLKRILQIRWQGKPLVIKENDDKYSCSQYLLFLSKEFEFIRQ